MKNDYSNFQSWLYGSLREILKKLEQHGLHERNCTLRELTSVLSKEEMRLYRGWERLLKMYNRYEQQRAKCQDGK